MNQKSSVNYLCPKCLTEELIPQEVIDFFDKNDPQRVPIGPPSFQCERCGYPYMLPKGYSGS